MKELHDLARRLVTRGEPDTHELLASRAYHDADLLFAAADGARKRASSMRQPRAAEWLSIAEALDSSAVHALRVNAIPRHEAERPTLSDAGPPLSGVTISVSVIEAGLADPTDYRAFLTDLLAAAQQTLHLSGNGWMWNEAGERVDAAIDHGGGVDEVLAVVQEYVHLTD